MRKSWWSKEFENRTKTPAGMPGLIMSPPLVSGAAEKRLRDVNDLFLRYHIGQSADIRGNRYFRKPKRRCSQHINDAGEHQIPLFFWM